MHPIILFVLKSILISAVFTAWYMLALKNRRLHTYNRFFLLFALYASIQVPLLRVAWSPSFQTAPGMLKSVTMVLHTLNGPDAVVSRTQAAPVRRVDVPFLLLCAAGLVSLVLTARMLLRIARVLRLRRRYPVSVAAGVTLVHTDLPEAPFSFLGTVYWRDSIPLDTETGNMILRHELAHAQQQHTLDKLAGQLLSCIFWMNPFYRIILKELAMVHEFIADEHAITQAAAISEDDYAAAFATMLLRVNGRPDHLAPEHRFFSSPIKRRLIMLQSNKMVRASLARRIAVVPLLAGSVLLFAFSPRRTGTQTVHAADKQIVLVVDAAHGGQDDGARSGAVNEKTICLNVARRLAELAPRYNIQVQLTRSADKSLTLQDRVLFSNKLRPDGFICIHAGYVKAQGTEQAPATFNVAVNTKNAKAEESTRLAYAILKAASRPEWVQTRGFSELNAFVLRESAVPGVLIEVGNIENKDQRQYLQDAAKLDELCSRILEGVVEAHQ